MAAPTKHDRRLTPVRADLAAERLEGTVDAPRYVSGEATIIVADRVPLWPEPDAARGFDTVLLFGEAFEVFDRKDGWAWGQARADGYVGYLPEKSLGVPNRAPTHRVASLGAQTYGIANMKTPPRGILPFGARVAVTDTQKDWCQIDNGLWMPAPQLDALDKPPADWVGVAEMFLGVPYVWGGRSSFGIDCSGLVQLSRQAAGHRCLRDSDMQEGAEGTTLDPDTPLRRGDLIFWKGHVGIMRDAETLLHANAHHMAVATEPLADAVSRIEAADGGPVTRRARPD